MFFNKWSKAKKFYREGVKLFAHQKSEAVKAFTQALTLEPCYEDAFYMRGWAKYFLGDYGDALSDFERLIGLDGIYLNDGTAYYSRAAVQEKLGNYESALRDYERFVARSDDTQAHILGARAVSRVQELLAAHCG